MSAQGPEASPKVASPVNFRNNFGKYSPGSIRSVQSSLTTLGPVSTPARLLPAPGDCPATSPELRFTFHNSRFCVAAVQHGVFYPELRQQERRSLFRMQEARLGVTEMAARLGRHRSTIYRELARNRFRDPDASRDSRRNISGYYPVTAQELARARRQRLAKLARHEELLSHVVDRLRAGWSPQQIAGRLRQEAGADGEGSGRLCHETIYRHVYGSEGRAEQLYLCLPRARRRRGTRHGRRPRGHRIPLEHGIACRPAEVATRESFGHW